MPYLMKICRKHGNMQENISSEYGAVIIIHTILKIYVFIKKVKSSMARSLPVENLLPQNVSSIMNYLQ